MLQRYSNRSTHFLRILDDAGPNLGSTLSRARNRDQKQQSRINVMDKIARGTRTRFNRSPVKWRMRGGSLWWFCSHNRQLCRQATTEISSFPYDIVMLMPKRTWTTHPFWVSPCPTLPEFQTLPHPRHPGTFPYDPSGPLTALMHDVPCIHETNFATQGRFSEAETLLKRSLSIRVKALGPEHPAVATSHTNIAEIYASQVILLTCATSLETTLLGAISGILFRY